MQKEETNFNPDWKLTLTERVIVALTLALPRIPGWPGCTDEQMEAVASAVVVGLPGGKFVSGALETLLVDAYKRGFEWCIENNADREYVAKAACDYADCILSELQRSPSDVSEGVKS